MSKERAPLIPGAYRYDAPWQDGKPRGLSAIGELPFPLDSQRRKL